MKQPLDNQEVIALEKYLREPEGDKIEEFSLASLQAAAKALPSERRNELIQEVAKITDSAPFASQELPKARATAMKKRNTKTLWARSIAGLAAAFLLLLMAPVAVNGSVDFPGVGTWIQQAVLRDSGLSWAYENGYVKGTMAQTSLDGVTLRILGVVADPVQTTVIYLLQGVEASANGSGNVPSVSITRVDGEGVASWTEPGNKTLFGQVGIVSTSPLTEDRSTLEVSLISAGTSRLSLTIEADREELSRLAHSTDLNTLVSLEGIDVAGQRITVTPSQVVVEYTISGGQFAQGLIPEDMTLKLVTASGAEISASSSHGPVTDGVRHIRTVFDRPADLNGAKLVIPVLAKFQDTQVAWSLVDGKVIYGVADAVFLQNVSYGAGQLAFEMVVDRAGDIWNFHGFEVENAAGEIHVLGHNRSNWWHPGDIDTIEVVGTRISLPEGFVPVLLRATEAEILVRGPWVMDLGQ
jgi:hypothetical protein